MRQFLLYSSIAVFAIFIGSQITEGVLLVPYWKSLSGSDFYAYYKEFGPTIGQFYTVLTIIAALIPIVISIYCWRSHKEAFKWALGSSVFALLFVACFYLYFKGANELFYQASLSELDLQEELITWNTWHWGRILLEVCSLVLLIISYIKMQKKHS